MKNEIVVGIDVSKDFSNFCILGPDNRKVKEFKAKHEFADLTDAIKKMKEAETQYNAKCVLVMESTGHYSRIPFYFFHQSCFKVCLVNPIQTNSIKNFSVRKVKTDKVDAYKIAVLYKLGELKPVNPPKEEIAEINLLCRQYFKLTDDIVAYNSTFAESKLVQ